MANQTKIEEYLRLFHMKHHAGDYTGGIPSDVDKTITEDTHDYIVKYKEGKFGRWTMEDVRNSIDDDIEKLFKELDECDQFTLQMTSRTPEDAKEWHVADCDISYGL